VPATLTIGELLTPEVGLKSPAAEAVRHQWLGQQRSVVMLRGVAREDAALQALQGPGLRYVNKVSEVSALLAPYRVFMLGVLAVAVAAVYLLLHWRFGRPAWRALLPTLLAGALTLALLAVAGQALQLFHVLALLLLLGVGVDYGIFLLAQPNRRDGRSFVSVTIAAASTLLAFGLLALSGTPALRAFGLTLGLGILLAWALTPFFIPNPESTAP
jgi:predicted exporter